MTRRDMWPLAWLAVVSVLLGAALHYASPAQAATMSTMIRAEVTWIGGDCWARTATGPDYTNRYLLAPKIVDGCAYGAVDYQPVTRGQFFGVDPNIGDAYAVSCTVTNIVTGALLATDYATKGNGHDVDCLRRSA